MGKYPYKYMRLAEDIEDTELKKDDIVMVVRELDYESYITYVDRRNDIHGLWVSNKNLKPIASFL